MDVIASPPWHSSGHGMLPVPPVKFLDLKRCNIDAVETAHVDVDLVRIGARTIERVDAACRAEGMRGRAGIEPIGRQRIGAADKLEAIRPHDEMQKALLGAN